MRPTRDSKKKGVEGEQKKMRVLESFAGAHTLQHEDEEVEANTTKSTILAVTKQREEGGGRRRPRHVKRVTLGSVTREKGEWVGDEEEDNSGKHCGKQENSTAELPVGNAVHHTASKKQHETRREWERPSLLQALPHREVKAEVDEAHSRRATLMSSQR
jgi:hypothetical protein